MKDSPIHLGVRISDDCNGGLLAQVSLSRLIRRRLKALYKHEVSKQEYINGLVDCTS